MAFDAARGAEALDSAEDACDGERVVDDYDEQGLPLWPAAERNKQPILDQLARVLPPAGGTLLEVASGSGQHAVHFAAHLSSWTFQPTEVDPELLAILGRRCRVSGLANLLEPLRLDAAAESWPVADVGGVYCANMVHIAPWRVAEGLFTGAGRVLVSGGLLLTYGPYMLSGAHTSESNARFDASLKSRDASWGVRDLDELAGLAKKAGIVLSERVPMPANNFFVVWQKQ